MKNTMTGLLQVDPNRLPLPVQGTWDGDRLTLRVSGVGPDGAPAEAKFVGALYDLSPEAS